MALVTNMSRAVTADCYDYEILSSRRRRLLRRSRRALRRHINPAGHLIEACVSRRVFTAPDAELIRSEVGNWNRQVHLMIKCIKRRPDSAFDEFLWALEETNQQHVANALLGNGENLMSDYHRRILKESRDALVNNVNVEGHLLDALLSNDAITHEDAEVIRAERDRGWKAQVRILLDCLLRRPDSAFDGFIKALLLTDQQHIANRLLENGLQVTVRLNLKRKRSESSSSGESSSPGDNDDNDIRTTINRLINDGLSKIQDHLSTRKRRRTESERMCTGDIDVECVERLVGLLEHFNRQIVSAQMGSILLTIVCGLREAVWDLRWLCRSEGFLEVCRSALIPKDLQEVVDVEVEFDEVAAGICIENLDRQFPPPPSPLDGHVSSFMPIELLDLVLRRVLSRRETGRLIRYEDLARVCSFWQKILSRKKFQRAFKRFVESSMRPYLFSPLLLDSKVLPPFTQPKAIVGVCLLRRRLYVARSETHLIEVYGVPDIASHDITATSVPDHVFLRSLDLSGVEMPFNMAASEPSNSLYLTDFTRNVGCVWRISPDDRILERKFADNVGRPIGINVSRDDYVIVVSEGPSCIHVFSCYAERMRSILLPPELEAPRQAVCTEPGRFALIHGYLEPLNRVVEIDASGHVIRSYGSTLGAGYEQIHWPAALVCDGRGRMLVGDRENRRVHLVDRNFRLKRHLLQLDRGSSARPRRLCIDDRNGVLYVGHTDPTIKVYRIAYPDSVPPQEDLLSRGINCFRSVNEKQEQSKATTTPSEEKSATGSESEVQKFRLPPAGPYLAMHHLNKIPVEFLQMIFLKAAAIEKRSRLQSTLVTVCRKWYEIVGVMHFRYRLVRFVKGHREYVKRRAITETSDLQSQMD